MREITPELGQIYTILCSNNGENVDIFEHTPTLKSYAEQCDHVTEFGVRWVVSTWGLLAGKPKTMVSYDINYHERIERVKKVAAENSIDFKFVRANTLNIVIDGTDLLFIDSLHTYIQLSKELALHASKVRKYIILHDTITYAHHGMGPELGGDLVPKGLLDAMFEFLKVNPNWKVKQQFTNNNGLTVLERL